MIKEILKTLSDTEIMAVAEQLCNEEVNEQQVYKQLVAKGNDGETLQQLFNEVNSDTFRGTLPRLVAMEISNRYRELINRI
jgi:hypothetical protein